MIELFLNHRQDAIDGIHLIDLFGLELHAKFLLEGQNKVEMLDGVPTVDALRRRLGGDLVSGKLENISGNSEYALKYE
jgi:hypothetical protein